MSKIHDKCLEPFYIEKDAHCYAVIETITPNPKYTKSKDTYIRPAGYYSTFGNALRAIAKLKLDLPEEEYYSIEEYLKKYELILEETQKLLNFKMDK